MPETNFPEPPADRWADWTGALSPGDEVYIITRDIYLDLFEKIFRRARKYGKNHDDSEDIANEVLELLYKKLQEICAGRTVIIKSLASLCWAWIHIYFNSIIARKRKDIPFLMENESYLTDIIEDLSECIRQLDEQSGRVITKYFFESKTLDEIAKEEGISLNKTYRIKESAERALYHCMKKKGYP